MRMRLSPAKRSAPRLAAGNNLACLVTQAATRACPQPGRNHPHVPSHAAPYAWPADRWCNVLAVNPLGWLDKLGAERTEKGQVLYVLYVIIAVLVIIVLLRFLGVV